MRINTGLLLCCLLTACGGESSNEDDRLTPEGTLVKATSTSLTAYFQDSLNQNNADIATEEVSQGEVAIPTEDSNAGFSSTLLQESGVDEADVVKSNGDFVFRIDNGDLRWGHDTPNRINVYALHEAQSTLTEVSSIPSEAEHSFTGLFLNDEQDQLIGIESNQGSFWDYWFSSSYFSAQTTGISIIDVADAGAPQVLQRFSFEGTLISSRRVDQRLLLVLRQFPDLRPWYDAATNTALTPEDVLPTYTAFGLPSSPLVTADNCYLNHSAAVKTTDIITLIAIDLNQPADAPISQCYVGQTEAVYTSPNALYIASTQWNYNHSAPQGSYDPLMTTDIHKFAFTHSGFNYAGSGQVSGHLGWQQNRKSFRISEHDGHLRVLSINEQRPWLDAVGLTVIDRETSDTGTDSAASTSPVMLTILKESETSDTLETVSQLPNSTRPEPIGKTAEQLYATRFLGDRAYAVTFRLTDPLYVLDLENPGDPFIAGELEVDGYSDYLFPLSENLLLGVGKDAIADTGLAGDEGRGAWYQGVKLSLFDISDATQPTETDQIILGERGTEATALYNHHGLSLLTQGDETRIAMPINLHDRAPQSSQVSGPWDYHQYTHTALRRFTVDHSTQLFSNDLPALVSSDWSTNEYGPDLSLDRSLIAGEFVHYFYRGGILSQDWLGAEDAYEPSAP